MSNTNSIVFSRLLYEEGNHKIPYGNLCSIVSLLSSALPPEMNIQIVDDNVAQYLIEQGIVKANTSPALREYQICKGSKPIISKIARKLDKFVKDKGELKVGIVNFMDTIEK